jgi:hypothetical protein
MQAECKHKKIIFILPFLLFSSPGPLGVRRLSFGVCKLFTFQASSPKPLGQIGTKLSRNVPWIVLYKFLFFVPVGYSTWLPGPIMAEISKIFFSETNELTEPKL